MEESRYFGFSSNVIPVSKSSFEKYNLFRSLYKGFLMDHLFALISIIEKSTWHIVVNLTLLCALCVGACLC